MKNALLCLALLPLASCMSVEGDGPEQGIEPVADTETEQRVNEDNSGSGEEVSDEEKREFLDSIDWCEEAGLDRFVGQPASEAVVAEAVAASGSKRVRVLAPGDAASMDYVTNRLNIMTDAQGLIVRLRCG